jgi:hypothetical protein
MLLRTIVGLIAVCGIVGCDVFETGVPENPADFIAYPQPTSTDAVLETIALSSQAQDNLAYLERLTSDFVFKPDDLQRQSATFGTFPDPWSRTHEEFFLRALFSNVDSMRVTWDNAASQFRGDEADVTADYVVETWGRTQSEYRGQAAMVMRQVAGIWYIHTWNDLAPANSIATWGLLRAQLLAAG